MGELACYSALKEVIRWNVCSLISLEKMQIWEANVKFQVWHSIYYAFVFVLFWF